MKIFVSDENLDPQHMLFCREIRFVARALFDFVCLKFSLEIFSVKTPTRGVFMLYTSFSIFSIFLKKKKAGNVFLCMRRNMAPGILCEIFV